MAIDRLGGTLRLEDVPVPEPRAGSVVVEDRSLGAHVLFEGLRGRPITDLQSAQRNVHAWRQRDRNRACDRPEVYHVKPGQRVMVSSHIVADENVPEPAQFLLGVTAGPAGKSLQADWRDGTLAEYALVPKSCVTPSKGWSVKSPTQLSALPRFAVPYGGLLRGRWPRGNDHRHGATGAYGGAAVLLSLALGAARVVAAGRNEPALDASLGVGGSRVATVALSGDIEADAGNSRRPQAAARTSPSNGRRRSRTRTQPGGAQEPCAAAGGSC